MDKYEKWTSKPTYYKHPLEDCVLRTQPNGEGGWDTWVRFSKEQEYQPARGTNIIIDAQTNANIEWISKEKYHEY